MFIGICKDLEQSFEAAEEVGEKAYKLQQLSATRLAEYFGVSVANFEKQMEINVVALKKGLRAWTRKFLRLQASCSKEYFHRVSALESENP